MDSMGPKINTRTRKVGGSTVWFPRGPALQHFSDNIRPEVERILGNIELSEVEKLIVKLYMIGRSEQKANPIIMICCCDKATRKEAEALIREDGLLDQDRNSGFGLGSTGFPLETNFLPRPLGKPIEFDTYISTKDTLQVDVYGVSEPRIGGKLGFIASSRSGQTIQYATGGPIIRVGGRVVQLTVAHAMKHHPHPEGLHQLDWDPDDCEFDGQSDEGDDDSIMLRKGSASPEDSLRDTEPDDWQRSMHSSTSSDQAPEIPYIGNFDAMDISATQASFNSKESEQSHDKLIQSNLLDSYTGLNWSIGELDYLLVKLPTMAVGSNQELNQITVDGPPRIRNIQVNDIASARSETTSILAITSRGAIAGKIIPDSMSLMTGGSSLFQQLLTVLLSKPLSEGDSGSAIIDPETGHFYGHVVLGVDGDCVAYVMPSPTTMASITIKYQKLPSFYHTPPQPKKPPIDPQSRGTLYTPGLTPKFSTAAQIEEARNTIYGR